MTRDTFKAKGTDPGTTDRNGLIPGTDYTHGDYCDEHDCHARLCSREHVDPEVLLRFTDSELMKELERRFMDINNLEGNKIWAWMNNYSCGNEVMSMMTKRAHLRSKMKEEAANRPCPDLDDLAIKGDDCD